MGNRRIIATLLCLIMVMSLACGCAPKLNAKTIRKNPGEYIRRGFEMAASTCDTSSYDPLSVLAHARYDGTISIDAATAGGPKINYTLMREPGRDLWSTEYTEKGSGTNWKCYMTDNGQFLFRTNEDASWYSLQMGADKEVYSVPALMEALNWEERKIHGQISKMYGEYIKDVLNNQTELTRREKVQAAILEVIKDKTPAMVTESVSTVNGSDHNCVAVSYELPPELAKKAYEAFITLFNVKDTTFDAYWDNVFVDILSKSGSDIYKNVEDDKMQGYVDVAANQLWLFNSKSAGVTTLSIAIDVKSNQVVDLSMLSYEKLSVGTTSITARWSIDDAEGKTMYEYAALDINSNGDFIADISLEKETSAQSTKGGYERREWQSYMSDYELWKITEEFMYNDNSDEFTVSAYANNQKLKLTGTVTTGENELTMVIDELTWGTEAPLVINIEINARAEIMEMGSIPVAATIGELSVDGIRGIIKNFATMPSHIFGTWEVQKKLNQKFYEPFDAEYDYNNDGHANKDDEAYYHHVRAVAGIN